MDSGDVQTDRGPTHSGGARKPLPKPERFEWPPRQIASPVEGGGATDEGPHRGAAGAPLSPWEHFEREWLCVTTPPLHRRLTEAGAAPDPVNRFCWRCARTIGPFETDARGCSKCRTTRPPWTRFVRLAEYAPPWDRIVQDAKFTRWPRLSVDLGRLLGRQIAAAVPDLHDRPTVVVPVPTNIWRRLARGTDHSLNIARGVAGELRLPVRKLLSRARRPEQSRLSRTDRATNLRGSMDRARLDQFWAAVGWTNGARWPAADGVLKRASAGMARLIVVDDISTTGATMSEACGTARQLCKSLQIQDLEIVAGAICRTEEAG